MELKRYQEMTLDILEKFLSAAKTLGCATAFETFRDADGYPQDYQPLPHLSNVPYICLRLPTGGGKTLIGTHAIDCAENFLALDFPFVLWLVPTKEIRQQTLKVLRDPKGFYGEFLRKKFGGRVNIFDVSDFRDQRLQDTGGLNICVATFQSFKVEDRDGRKVFQANEDMTPYFRNIPRQDYFYIDERGRHESFANLIAYLRPLMIVDEAHNHSTPLATDLTEQLRPSAVIELTATPAATSNVLVKVSAETLRDAEMIKLPVVLGEVTNSPEKTLDYATQKRAALEKLAAAENDYVRPIALYQAENRNREYNVDYIENYLLNEAKIPAREIAVATGERHELDGVNLLATACPIRHIITVQALKEGWDCPFASVFCSLSNTHSARDAEQLLGRVLRMPNARRRTNPELNKAYAFVRVASWEEAVAKIKDNLLDMGFDRREVDNMVKRNRQQQLFYTTIKIQTSEPPAVDGLNFFLQTKIAVEKNSDGYAVTFNEVDDYELNELEHNRLKIFRTADDRAKLTAAIRQTVPPAREKLSPAERGVKFSVPQLCLDFGRGAQVIDGNDFFPDGWSLVGTGDYDLPLSHDEPDLRRTEFDVHGGKLTVRALETEANLFSGATNWTRADLIRWLLEKIDARAVTPEDFAEFTRRTLNRLEHEKNFSQAELVRMRFSIRKLLAEKISACIDTAKKRAWQTKLFDTNLVRVDRNIAFTFKPNCYPATEFYTGEKIFNKHFYAQVGKMNDEEIICAQFIDSNPNVETWIRNLDRDERNAFWLQTSTDKFYPDFVVKLKDGTFAAVEYKGSQLADGSDTREKNLLGELWANKSDGLCKFVMAVATDARGRNLSTQLSEALSFER